MEEKYNYKICRVAISYPTSELPGAGLVNYYLTKNIKLKTLYLTIKRKGIPKEIDSNNLTIKFFNIANKSSSIFFSKKIEKKISFFSKIYIYLVILKKGKGLNFFFRSIIPILKFNPDLIACHSILTIMQGVFFKILFRKKFVLHLHNMSDANAINNLYILRFFVAMSDRIYCVSKPMTEILQNKLPAKKIILTSTGVDPKIFFNQNILRKKQILMVGRIHWNKGYKYMLQAMKKLVKKFPDYNLLIIGDGEEVSALINLVDNLGLKNYVTIKSKASHSELVTFYNESKLFVMSSLYEGLPKVLLESFACGLPAVITDQCNAEKISENRAEIVKTKSSDDLFMSISRLISDKSRWQKYSNNCVSIIETHNWDIISKSINNDYDTIMK